MNQEQNIHNLKTRLHNKLLQELDIKSVDLSSAQQNQEIKLKAKKIFENLLVKEEEAKYFTYDKKIQIINELLNETLGLGALEPLLSDPTITEIMIIGKDKIYIERAGKLILTGAKFSSFKQITNIIERIVSPIGRRVDESTPLCDARLSDGSRVNIVLPPLSLDGPVITIRKFIEKKLSIQDLIKFGSLTENMGEFLRICVLLRKNIIVSGGTGSGKTTLLNILSSFIPEEERIVTIEDSAELKLQHQHLVRLETRPPNIESKGEITIRQLVINALRMRPDRIVVGECRGQEALDMLQAMNTGHDGSLTTVHSNSSRDALSRIEIMVLMSGMELPIRAIREQIKNAIDIIVQQTRMSDGSRKVVLITEICGIESDVITTQDIFKFNQTGLTFDNKVTGNFQATGIIPTFIDEIKTKGINFDINIFK